MKKMIGRVLRWVRGDGEPEEPADPSPTPHVWQVGDMAECIAPPGHWWGTTSQKLAGPVHGEIRRVESIFIGPGRDFYTSELKGDMVGLGFARYPHTYVASAFRPVKPRADAQERCADEFALLTELIGDRQKMPVIHETTETGNRT